MYFRVKRFRTDYQNMYVLDKDNSLAALKSRTNRDSSQDLGYKPFNNATFVESQSISYNGKPQNTDIIRN